MKKDRVSIKLFPICEHEHWDFHCSGEVGGKTKNCQFFENKWRSFEASRIKKKPAGKINFWLTDYHLGGGHILDTESIMDGYIAFNKEESFDRRDSRTITLVHKYAASFTGHYEMLDKLNHDVEEIIERFNVVLDFIHQQLQLRSGKIHHQS